MKRLLIILLFLPVAAWLVTMVGAACSDAVTEDTTSAISRVEQMPNLPQPFAMRDWPQVTRDYLDLVFDFDQHGDHLPLVSWTDESHTMVSIPSYVGGPNDPEAINYLAAVVSGSLVGLDMRSFRGQDWVTMGTNFFNADEGVYVNRLHGRTGKSFWYDIFPNVLSYQINARIYSGEPARDRQALCSDKVARRLCERWRQKRSGRGPNFDHGGLRLKKLCSQWRTADGSRTEEAAAGDRLD